MLIFNINLKKLMGVKVWPNCSGQVAHQARAYLNILIVNYFIIMVGGMTSGLTVSVLDSGLNCGPDFKPWLDSLCCVFVQDAFYYSHSACTLYSYKWVTLNLMLEYNSVMD